jgi:hypothetical protein
MLLLCGWAGRAIAEPKEAGTPGFWFGVLLGPIGVVIAAMLDRRSNCPVCGSKLNGKPSICAGCQTEFEWKGKECTYYPPKKRNR